MINRKFVILNILVLILIISGIDIKANPITYIKTAGDMLDHIISQQILAGEMQQYVLANEVFTYEEYALLQQAIKDGRVDPKVTISEALQITEIYDDTRLEQKRNDIMNDMNERFLEKYKTATLTNGYCSDLTGLGKVLGVEDLMSRGLSRASAEKLMEIANGALACSTQEEQDSYIASAIKSNSGLIKELASIADVQVKMDYAGSYKIGNKEGSWGYLNDSNFYSGLASAGAPQRSGRSQKWTSGNLQKANDYFNQFYQYSINQGYKNFYLVASGIGESIGGGYNIWANSSLGNIIGYGNVGGIYLIDTVDGWVSDNTYTFISSKDKIDVQVNTRVGQPGHRYVAINGVGAYMFDGIWSATAGVADGKQINIPYTCTPSSTNENTCKVIPLNFVGELNTSIPLDVIEYVPGLSTPLDIPLGKVVTGAGVINVEDYSKAGLIDIASIVAGVVGGILAPDWKIEMDWPDELDINIAKINGMSMDLPQGGINFQPILQIGDTFTERFPFSLPFDLINTIKIFNSEPMAPVLTMNVNAFIPEVGDDIEQIDFKLDFNKFSNLAKIIRTFELLIFIVFLIKVTPSITNH